MSGFISEGTGVDACDDLFVWKREVIGFCSFICRAPHREIFLETFLYLFIFFPAAVYLLALGVDYLCPFGSAKLGKKYFEQ